MALYKRGEFFQGAGDGGVGIFGGFVFEDEVALVIGVAEDFDEAREVGGLFLRAFGLEFGFELDVDGVGSAAGEVAVGIVGVEIGGIEVDAEPGALDGFDDVEEGVGFRDDAAMVFEAEHDAVFAGVGAAFFKGFNAILLRDVEGLAFGVAGEDADVRDAHEGGVVDPLFGMGNLFVAFFASRKGEGVADAGAAEFYAAEEGVALQFEEEIASGIGREVVAGEFGGLAVVFGAVVDELEEVDLFAGGSGIVAVVG